MTISPPSPHSFHIPVMGLAFTMDSPIKVARFGISSTISIMEDNLIEKMRKHYYSQVNQEFVPIPSTSDNYRANRIMDYLNLVDQIVKNQMVEMRTLSFDQNNDLCNYFEMLPDSNPDKKLYIDLKNIGNPMERTPIENYLKTRLIAGQIDVNIMTKLDVPRKDKFGQEILDQSDAVTAMKGFMDSNLTNSTVVLSAGMNPRLYAYMEGKKALQPNAAGEFDKKLCIKVSDYRSAFIQGKMLAKKGLWVSEFRIESGLNCGGHAFATDGYLLGPILEEFKLKRTELFDAIYQIYKEAISGADDTQFSLNQAITVQGGIGTNDEDAFLRKYYELDGTGWGTPFLLVPEATTVDTETLNLLLKAKENDVYLSKNSPLGVRFHYLRNTSSDLEKKRRIAEGKPGSPCTEKYISFNTEFTDEPICTASRKYQKKKIEQIKGLNLPEDEMQRQLEEVMDKECLCIGLSNSAVSAYNLDPFKRLEAINICPGPNIAYFNRIPTLKQMVDHIYGRIQLVEKNRPHMFIKELNLYVDYWMDMAKELSQTYDAKKEGLLKRFHQNLLNGISYYKELHDKLQGEMQVSLHNIQVNLNLTEARLNKLLATYLNNTTNELVNS